MSDDTIQITEHSRLRVVTDEHAENPRGDWDSMITGFVKIPGRGDSRIIDVLPVHDDTLGIAEAHDRFGNIFQSHSDVWSAMGAPDPEELVVRWAAIFHGTVVEYDWEHGGYWFLDPKMLDENFPASPTGRRQKMLLNPLAKASGWTVRPNYYVTWVRSDEVEREIIAQEQETYRMWAESEVSGVILEHLTEWVLLAQNDEPVHPPRRRHQWEEVESTWGCYLNDNWTAQQVALDSFTLTNTEIDALRQ